jgi:hypothetical protein
MMMMTGVTPGGAGAEGAERVRMKRVLSQVKDEAWKVRRGRRR